MRYLGAADFRGVREHRSGVFSSEISFGEKRLSLGTFDIAEEAARAYDAVAWRLWPWDADQRARGTVFAGSPPWGVGDWGENDPKARFLLGHPQAALFGRPWEAKWLEML